MITRDLFGTPLPPREQRIRRRIGYADRPGTGPKGQRCNTCSHCIKIDQPGHEGLKCELSAPLWNRLGSVIKGNAPACSYWERKTYPKAIAI